MKGYPIYLVRHGAIDNGPPKRFIGQTDLPLTRKGQDQASQLAVFFSSINFKTVITSCLQRTIQTAEIITGLPSSTFENVAELNEIYLGEWENCPIEKIKATQPEFFIQRGRDFAGFRPPGGESFQDLADRCWPRFHSLLQQAHFPTLIVSHAGVNRVLLAQILGIPLQKIFTIKQPYCMVNAIKPVNGKYTVKQMDICSVGG